MEYSVEETRAFIQALTTPKDDIEGTWNITSTDGGFLCEKCKWGDFGLTRGILRDAKYCPNCGRPVLGKRECS